jgi:hypothetical protein
MFIFASAVGFVDSIDNNKINKQMNLDENITLTEWGKFLENWRFGESFYRTQATGDQYMMKLRLLLDDFRSYVTEQDAIRPKKLTISVRSGLRYEYMKAGLEHGPNQAWDNRSMKQAKSSDKLIELYKQNKLITTRLGIVESMFIAAHVYGIIWPKQLTDAVYKDKGIDYRMQANAGLYFTDEDSRRKTLNWYAINSIEIIRRSIPTSCISFVWSDLALWSAMGLSGDYYNWGTCVLFDMYY